MPHAAAQLVSQRAQLSISGCFRHHTLLIVNGAKPCCLCNSISFINSSHVSSLLPLILNQTMVDLTEKQQEAAYREIFDKYDEDKSGTISREELGKIFITLGLDDSRPELNEIFANADDNRTGTIDFSEFLEMMIAASEADDDSDDGGDGGDEDPEELREQLKRWDKNGDGKISSAELRAFVESEGADISEEELNALIVDLDTNRNGMIEYDEFIVMLTK